MEKSATSPANSSDALAQRNADRLRKSDYRSAGKSEFSQGWSNTHARLGNDVDTVITSMGSKTFGAIKGGLWGAAKGIFVGIGLATIASLATVFGPPAWAFAAGLVITAFSGARSGYYKAEMNAAGNKGKKAGDRVAAAGGAQEKRPRPEIMKRAMKEAEKDKEMPHPDAAERQSTEPDLHQPSYHFRDKINAERAASQNNPRSPVPFP